MVTSHMPRHGSFNVHGLKQNSNNNKRRYTMELCLHLIYFNYIKKKKIKKINKSLNYSFRYFSKNRRREALFTSQCLFESRLWHFEAKGMSIVVSFMGSNIHPVC